MRMEVPFFTSYLYNCSSTRAMSFPEALLTEFSEGSDEVANADRQILTIDGGEGDHLEGLTSRREVSRDDVIEAPANAGSSGSGAEWTEAEAAVDSYPVGVSALQAVDSYKFMALGGLVF